MRVLLATAQTDLRLSLEFLLSEQPGVDIVGAASEGEGLLALIQTAKPDIVVTDWNLPGRPLPTILKNWTKPQKLKIIILIGDEGDHNLARACEVDAIVLKGGPPELLLKTFLQISQRHINPGEEKT